jgi:hypothetical protein
MWLALPITALRYWQVWDRLPARMATHFNAAGQPNGWMTREANVEFGIGVTVFILLIFTVISYVLQRQKVTDIGSWALLGVMAVVVGVIYQANSSVIDYNLTGEPVTIFTAVIALPLIVVLIAVFVGAKRGKPLAEAAPIAEERHASLIIACVLLVPLLAPIIFLGRPEAVVRWAALPVAIMLAACAAFAWNGFLYRFSPQGLEIRTLGFRLRSIAAAEILDYKIEGWSILRGYGIRGVGGYRAYVWGNKVVHIHTTQGDVYLGHDRPEKIVHDLDMVRQYVH